jgi:hypothetical protein
MPCSHLPPTSREQLISAPRSQHILASMLSTNMWKALITKIPTNISTEEKTTVLQFSLRVSSSSSQILS